MEAIMLLASFPLGIYIMLLSQSPSKDPPTTKVYWLRDIKRGNLKEGLLEWTHSQMKLVKIILSKPPNHRKPLEMVLSN